MKEKKLEILSEMKERYQLQTRLRKEQERERLNKLAATCPSTFCQGTCHRKFSDIRDITEIRPYLLLCGAFALRGNVLADLGVTCVINATNELPDTPLPHSVQSDILYLRVSVDDKSDSDILSWLDSVADLIHQVKSASGRTLIHCVAGTSRSATLCLAYLIKYEGYSLFDSYNMLKELRSIRPNSGFFAQLVEFEKRVTGKQTVLMIRSEDATVSIPHMYRLPLLRVEDIASPSARGGQEVWATGGASDITRKILVLTRTQTGTPVQSVILRQGTIGSFPVSTAQKK